MRIVLFITNYLRNAPNTRLLIAFVLSTDLNTCDENQDNAVDKSRCKTLSAEQGTHQDTAAQIGTNQDNISPNRDQSRHCQPKQGPIKPLSAQTGTNQATVSPPRYQSRHCQPTHNVTWKHIASVPTWIWSIIPEVGGIMFLRNVCMDSSVILTH